MSYTLSHIAALIEAELEEEKNRQNFQAINFALPLEQAMKNNPYCCLCFSSFHERSSHRTKWLNEMLSKIYF